MTNDVQLSEYELARLENIKKNEEFLKSIGLYKDPATIAYQDTLPKGKAKKPRTKRKSTDDNDEKYFPNEVLAVPSRRSARNSGGPVSHVKLEDDEVPSGPKAKRQYNPLKDSEEFFKNLENGGDGSDTEDDESKRVVLKPAEIREYVMSISPEHSAMISNKAVELCAYRCGYMSLAALKNRIKAVSRGASKKSYEKLLVVSYTMRAMGLHRLAETAAALLKARTGLVLDWCPAGGVKEEYSAEELEGGTGAGVEEMQEVKVEVKEEGNGEEKGAAEVLVKMEGNNEAAGGGLKKVKSEPGLLGTGVELVEVKEEVPVVVAVARRSSRGKKDVVSPVSAHS